MPVGPTKHVQWASGSVQVSTESGVCGLAGEAGAGLLSEMALVAVGTGEIAEAKTEEASPGKSWSRPVQGGSTAVLKFFSEVFL